MYEVSTGNLPGKGHGWGDFWKSTEDVTAFADWFDRHLKDRLTP